MTDSSFSVSGLPAGEYGTSVSVMGGDAGDQEMYLYVKINGEAVMKKDTSVTSWNRWDTAEISGIQVAEGDLVTVGIYVRCGGAGAWGKIDDFRLNSAGDYVS